MRHEVKRSPLVLRPTPEQLRTGSTLARSTAPIARNVEIRRVSAKLKKSLSGNDGYRAFSQAVRQTRPVCEIQWEGVCTHWTQSVHHVIKLSQGGARVPGEVADLQAQKFMAACIACNREVENQPAEARKRGLVRSNPLRRPGLMEKGESL